MVSDDLSFPPANAKPETNRSLAHDVLALDAAGRVVYDLRAYPMPNAGRTQQMANIPNFVSERVVSFRLQARPHEWVEFRNVQIRPTAG
jgi:hypothetical protein